MYQNKKCISSQTNTMDIDNVDDELILDATEDLSAHDVGSRSPSPGSVCFRTPQQSVAYITQSQTGAVPQIQAYSGPTQVVSNVLGATTTTASTYATFDCSAATTTIGSLGVHRLLRPRSGIHTRQPFLDLNERHRTGRSLVYQLNVFHQTP